MKKLLLLFIITIFSNAFAGDLGKIDPLSANKLFTEKKAIIVDVREPREQKGGMVKSALSVPLSTMKNNNDEWEKIVKTFPKDKTVVVYCGIGAHAEIVGLELAKKGYKVLNMGGFDSWVQEGLPTEKK
jgi:rhodanese-related sulfurtransferase